MLAIVGYLIMAVILYALMTKKLSVIVAMITVPVIGLIIVGQTNNIGKFISDGISSMAATGVMFIFSILFFGIMRDAGAFDPVVKNVTKWCKGSPVLIVVGAYLLGIVGHLDGAGATTFLLAIPAMLPLFDNMKMNRYILACVVAIAAGTMNILPWGGPTLRAATVLEVDVTEIYNALMITQIVGLLAGLGVAFYLGKKEEKRLKSEGLLITDLNQINLENYEEQIDESAITLRRPNLLVFNILLVIATIGIMISKFVPPAVAFMLGTAIALIVNYPDSALQRKIIDSHAVETIMMASILFAAGALNGILKGSGMSTAMAEALVNIVPKSLGSHLSVIMGYLGVPLCLVIDVDSYYFGIMPIIANTIKQFGISPMNVAYASLAGGLSTTGFPIMPTTAATYLLVGLAGIDLGSHQKFSLKYMWFVGATMLTFAIITGVVIL